MEARETRWCSDVGGQGRRRPWRSSEVKEEREERADHVVGAGILGLRERAIWWVKRLVEEVEVGGGERDHVLGLGGWVGYKGG